MLGLKKSQFELFDLFTSYAANYLSSYFLVARFYILSGMSPRLIF